MGGVSLWKIRENLMSLENKFSLMIVLLLAVDVLLMWKMVYGAFPWESQAAQ